MAKKKVKKKNLRRWSKAEVRILKKYYCGFSTQEVSEKLARTSRAIAAKAYSLGLYKNDRQKWSQIAVKRLKKYHPRMSARRVAQKLGRTSKSVEMKASQLGLHKTKKYLREWRWS